MNRAHALWILLLPSILAGQSRIGTGMVAELYQQHCSVCHGDKLEGGLGPNLVDDEWVHGSTDEDLARVIREGVPEEGMVPYGNILSSEDTLALVIYLREMKQLARTEAAESESTPMDGIFQSTHHAFRLEKVAQVDDDIFWSVSFLPDGGMLLTQFGGKLFVCRDGRLGEPVAGIPESYRRGQGGLLEAVAHPDYAENGWIYLAFTGKAVQPESGEDGYMTAIVRGRIKDGRWVDGEEIFRAPARFHTDGGVHYGSRIVFDKGYLYFSIGDRGRMNDAQDLSRPNGKIHRIHDDGRIPDDNPFVDVPDAFPSIWTYGNRNPQGLDKHPSSGQLWSTEHGPRGGDELNLIEGGRNYGWPEITHGINYNGRPITDKTSAPGMEQPVHYWTPSIAVCGIDFYEGDAFPAWKNDLFVSALRSQQLERFKLEGTKVVEHEIIFKGHGRVRDVSTGPDGMLYVILNEDRNSGPGAVYRLVPSGL